VRRPEPALRERDDTRCHAPARERAGETFLVPARVVREDDDARMDHAARLPSRGRNSLPVPGATGFARRPAGPLNLAPCRQETSSSPEPAPAPRPFPPPAPATVRSGSTSSATGTSQDAFQG